MQSTPSNERQLQRIERFTQIFTRVNSVLTLRPLKVATKFSPRNAPAWSTAEEITFNARLLGSLDTPREIAAIKGLDLHEVAHVLYTPRNGSELVDWVQERGYFLAWNALEDQRIETLLVGRYPSIKDWLTATMLIHLVETPNFDNAYPLLYGRRYLPIKLRKSALDAYKNPHKVPLLRSIIDEYRLLLFPQDTERAKQLIEEFHHLVIADPDQPDEGGLPDPHGHGDRPHEGQPTTGSRPAPKREQERDRDNAKRQEERDESEDDFDDLDDDSDGNGDGSSDTDTDDDSDADGSGNGGKDDGNETDTDSTPAGNDGGCGGTPSPDVAKALNDMIDEIINDNEREIENISRQIKGLPTLASDDVEEPTKREIKHTMPDSDTVAAARSFGRELERIRTAYDPAWDKQQSAGRLNALRAGRGDELTTVYDAWSMGRQDATEIECVILLDVSGSMSGKKADAAYRSMYAIKRALDRINANTSVITFESSTNLLYSRDEKADLYIRDGGASGGTEATHAVQYATKLLAETDKPVRLFIAVTDGEWYNEDEANEGIARMRRSGVLTALAYISDYGSAPMNTHNCETVVVIKNISDIIGIARGVVRNGISRRLLNA